MWRVTVHLFPGRWRVPPLGCCLLTSLVAFPAQQDEAFCGSPQTARRTSVTASPAVLQMTWGMPRFALKWKVPHSFLPADTVKHCGKRMLVKQVIPPGSESNFRLC